MRGGLRLFFFGKSVFVKHPNGRPLPSIVLFIAGRCSGMWEFCKSCFGFFFITTASLLFGVCNVLVKLVRYLQNTIATINPTQIDSVGPFNIAVYRCLGVAIPAISIMIYRGEVIVIQIIIPTILDVVVIQE